MMRGRPGEGAADAAAVRHLVHDLRQPVAAIRTLAAAAAAESQACEPVLRRLQQIYDQAGWLSATINDALLSSGPGGRRDGPVDVRALVQTAVAAERLTYPGRITLDDRGTDDSYVVASAVRLRRAVANVLANAVTAAGPSGSVQVTRRADSGAEIIEIIDDGPGLGHVLQGHGLGLQIAREALADCAGRLEMERRPSGHTLVRLIVPLATTVTAAGARCE
jgi:signal transduction histidine kinase